MLEIASTGRTDCMAKSGRGSFTPIPESAGTPRVGDLRRTQGPADLIRPAEPAPDLKSFLAKAPSAGATPQPTAAFGYSPDAPKPMRDSSAAGEGDRLARDGARFLREGRLAEAIAALQRSVQLNPLAAGSHHDLGLALLAAGRLEQAVAPFLASLHIH